jgi:hypothetical protein
LAKKRPEFFIENRDRNPFKHKYKSLAKELGVPFKAIQFIQKHYEDRLNEFKDSLREKKDIDLSRKYNDFYDECEEGFLKSAIQFWFIQNVKPIKNTLAVEANTKGNKDYDQIVGIPNERSWTVMTLLDDNEELFDVFYFKIERLRLDKVEIPEFLIQTSRFYGCLIMLHITNITSYVIINPQVDEHINKVPMKHYGPFGLTYVYDRNKIYQIGLKLFDGTGPNVLIDLVRKKCT